MVFQPCNTCGCGKSKHLIRIGCCNCKSCMEYLPKGYEVHHFG